MTTRLSLNSNDFDCRRQQQPPVVKKRNKKFQKFIFIWGGCNLIKRPSVAFVTLPVALIKATDCVGSLQPLHFSFRLAGKKSSQISDFRAAVRRSLAASWKKNVHAPTVSVNPPRPKKAATVWCYLPRFWKKSKRNQRSGQLPRGKSPANASRSLCYRPECQTVMRSDELRNSKNSQRFGYLRKWMMAEQWKLLEIFDNFIQNEFNWLTNCFIKILM